MAQNYPKFDKKIQEQIDISLMRESKTRFGVLMFYDKGRNTGTIILEDVNTESMGSVLYDVPFPLQMGIQAQSPKPGSRCVIGFRDQQERYPYIVSFVDDVKRGRSYVPNHYINTGVPNFLIGE